MSRHSKNNTSSAVFTNYERARVKAGTIKQRVGHDSLKSFDSCSITFELVVNPVADNEGHIYSKPNLVQYLVDQKEQYKIALKAYKKQQEALQQEEAAKQDAILEKKITAFDNKETSLVSPLEASRPRKSSSLSNTTLNCFWSPQLTPENRTDILKKPSKVIKSPFGHPISLKCLTPLTLTPIPDAAKDKPGRYMCPMCKKCLNNVSGVYCLKTNGQTFCSTCMDKYVRTEMICPITSSKFELDDILQLESEGTSFAGRTGEKLIAKIQTPAARFG